jgi:hypothetical protein
MHISFLQSTMRLAQLDKIAERLSHHVMGHYEEMGMSSQNMQELYQFSITSFSFFCLQNN